MRMTMRKILKKAAFALFFCCVATYAGAENGNGASLKKAVSAVKEGARGQYAKARSSARESSDKTAVKLTEWLYLTDTKASPPFEEAAAFIKKNPEWPRLNIIRRQAEKALLKQDDDGVAEKWFAVHPPVTTAGALRYADILFKRKEWEKAVPMLHALWIKGDMTPEERRTMTDKYGVLLDEHDYVSLIRRLLRDKKNAEARAFLPFADERNKKIIGLRLALSDNVPDVKGLSDIEKYKSDTELMFDIIRWTRLNKNKKKAAKLLDEHETEKTEPSLWWEERAALIRDFIAEKKYKDAYLLAKNSRLTEGADYADAQWTAGWLALRFLNDPRGAAAHFLNMGNAVASAVSVARAAYWAGRAFEVSKDDDNARAHYEKAAAHITTLYGQLAGEKIKKYGGAPAVPADPVPPETRLTALRGNELFRAALLVQLAGEITLAETFTLRLYARLNTAEDIAALGFLLTRDLKRRDLAVDITRRARLKSIHIGSVGYPLINVPADGIEPAAVLAVIRQESNFAPHAVSGAGARGLMQLMPATAKQVSGKKTLKAQKLNEDPEWNVTIGSRYLKQLIKKYDGSYVLTFAAYNAGPGNVNRWLKTMGQPGENIEDVLDWMEQIPFAETRNYVMRVLENLYVYRLLLNYPSNTAVQWSPVSAAADGEG